MTEARENDFNHALVAQVEVAIRGLDLKGIDVLALADIINNLRKEFQAFPDQDRSTSTKVRDFLSYRCHLYPLVPSNPQKPQGLRLGNIRPGLFIGLVRHNCYTAGSSLPKVEISLARVVKYPPREDEPATLCAIPIVTEVPSHGLPIISTVSATTDIPYSRDAQAFFLLPTRKRARESN